MNKYRLFALVTSAIMMVTFCTNSTNVIRLNATPQTDANTNANANSQQTNQAQQQEEDQNTIYIDSVDDLIQLSKDCQDDSYSVGKKFVLNKDLDLKGSTFEAIPSFSGTFDGKGHTISGYSVNKDCSLFGLFRYVQKDGLVRDLNVTGNIVSTGTGKTIGAIAGTNYGSIVSCSFAGAISGSNYIGAIVGLNEETGIVNNCTSKAVVKGDHYVGGIAGSNSGVILRSTSNSEVNITVEEITIDLESIDIKNLVTTENFKSVTDVGGITGYSKGTIQGCINNGNVGYLHIGYNIGGIVGRQSGYINGCTNNGTIYGRKDIGGIVGQMEPYSLLQFSESNVQSLRNELKTLGSILQKTYNDIKAENSQLNVDMNKVHDSIADAKSNVNDLVDQTTDIINSDVGSINQLSAYVSQAMDDLASVSNSIKKSTGNLSGVINGYSNALNSIKSTVAGMSSTVDSMTPILNQLSNTLSQVDSTFNSLSDSLSSISNSIGDSQELVNQIENLKNIVSQLSNIYSEASKIVKQLSDIANNYQGDEELKAYFNSFSNSLNTLAGSLQNMYNYTNDINKKLQALEDLVLSGNYTPEEFDNAIRGILSDVSKLKELNANMTQNVTNCLNDLYNLVSKIYSISGSLDGITIGSSESIKNIGDSLDSINNSIQGMGSIDADTINQMVAIIDSLKNTSDQIGDMANSTKDLVSIIKQQWPNMDDTSANILAVLDSVNSLNGQLSSMGNNINSAFSGLSNMFSWLSDSKDIVFVGTDKDFDVSKDNLSNSIDDVMDAVKHITDGSNLEGSVISQDLESLYNQSERVISIMLDIFEQYQLPDIDITDDNISEYIDDISTQDTVSQTIGKVASSINYGEIEGDLNVGGVAGTMAFELDVDPEEDLNVQGNTSLNFLYKTRDVIRNCYNYGTISSKKNNVGGIVGDMSLGCVLNSTAFGSIKSNSGNYVGGIAGLSEATIVHCEAKCDLSGGNYIGGIVGSGEDVSNCATMVRVTEGDEFIGAIAGETTGSVTNNIFVSDDLNGIDSISYSGVAERLDYKEFIKQDVSETFSKFTLTFKVDDKTYDVVNFNYGDSLTDGQIPNIPQKDGYFAEWDKTDYSNLTFDETINAVYTRYITAIASTDTRENGLAKILVNGNFSARSTVEVTTPSQVTNLSKNICELLEISITDATDDTYTVRYLPVDTEKDYSIYTLDDGVWHKADTTKDGSYILFDVNSNDTIICSVDNEGWLAIALIVIAVLIVLVLIVLIRLKRKNKTPKAPKPKKVAKTPKPKKEKPKKTKKLKGSKKSEQEQETVIKIDKTSNGNADVQDVQSTEQPLADIQTTEQPTVDTQPVEQEPIVTQPVEQSSVSDTQKQQTSNISIDSQSNVSNNNVDMDFPQIEFDFPTVNTDDTKVEQSKPITEEPINNSSDDEVEATQFPTITMNTTSKSKPKTTVTATVRKKNKSNNNR